MAKKNTVIINEKTIEELDNACSVALTNYKTIKANSDAKASELTAARDAMDKSISAYNDRVLASLYAGFRSGEVNPFVALFAAGTWDKRKYSAKEDTFVSMSVRLDVFDFIACSEELHNPVCSKSAVKTKLDLLSASVRDRVAEELAQAKDIHVSIGAIVKALQGVMDVLEVPEFEIKGQKAKVYARPKDARFLCACSSKASRKLGGVEVLKAEKIAAYITDIYFKQINHEDYNVEVAK